MSSVFRPRGNSEEQRTKARNVSRKDSPAFDLASLALLIVLRPRKIPDRLSIYEVPPFSRPSTSSYISQHGGKAVRRLLAANI